MNRPGRWICFSLLALLVVWEAHASPPVVAVFDILNRDTPLTRSDLATLTEYLSTRLGERGTYQIVPPEEIRHRLLGQKAESYKACYDQSCQIEVGRELAAQYTVSASINRIGTQCVITAAMYDLKKAATEKTATAKGPCRAEDLLDAMETIAARLTTSGPSVIRPTSPVDKAPPVDTGSTEPRLANAKISPTQLRFVTADAKRQFTVSLFAADGRSYSCEEVRAGQPCSLGDLAQGEARMVVRTGGLGTYTDDVDIEDDREVWVYTLDKRASHGSVIAWTFGGIGMATGAALIPVGLVTDSNPMVVGGMGSALAGVGLLVLGFFFDGNVDVSEDELELSAAREQPTLPVVTLLPSPGGVSLVGRF